MCQSGLGRRQRLMRRCPLIQECLGPSNHQLITQVSVSLIYRKFLIFINKCNSHSQLSFFRIWARQHHPTRQQGGCEPTQEMGWKVFPTSHCAWSVSGHWQNHQEYHITNFDWLVDLMSYIIFLMHLADKDIQVLHFESSPKLYKFTDLSETTLDLTIRVVRGDGSPLTGPPMSGEWNLLPECTGEQIGMFQTIYSTASKTMLFIWQSSRQKSSWSRCGQLSGSDSSSKSNNSSHKSNHSSSSSRSNSSRDKPRVNSRWE